MYIKLAVSTGPTAATWTDTIVAVARAIAATAAAGVIAAMAAAGVIPMRAVATRAVAGTSDGLHGPPTWPRS